MIEVGGSAYLVWRVIWTETDITIYAEFLSSSQRKMFINPGLGEHAQYLSLVVRGWFRLSR